MLDGLAVSYNEKRTILLQRWNLIRLPLTSAYKRELAKSATRLLNKKGEDKLDYVAHALKAAWNR